jgi:hypothetical protein
MSYEGPGEYVHYKGGTYTALGIGEHESTRQQFVVYESHDAEHAEQRRRRGVDFILRPLNWEDTTPRLGADPWNSTPVGKAAVTRFTKVDP